MYAAGAHGVTVASPDFVRNAGNPELVVSLFGTNTAHRRYFCQSGAQSTSPKADGLAGMLARLFAQGPANLTWDDMSKSEGLSFFEIRGD